MARTPEPLNLFFFNAESYTEALRADGAWPTHTLLPASTARQQVGRTPHYPRPRPPAPRHSPARRRQEAVLERRRSAPANQKSPAGLRASHRIGHQALGPASGARFSNWERREIFCKRNHWRRDGYAPCFFGSPIGSLEEKAANDVRLPEWSLVGAAGARAGGRQRARSNWRLAALPWGRGLADAWGGWTGRSGSPALGLSPEGIISVSPDLRGNGLRRSPEVPEVRKGSGFKPCACAGEGAPVRGSARAETGVCRAARTWLLVLRRFTYSPTFHLPTHGFFSSCLENHHSWGFSESPRSSCL